LLAGGPVVNGDASRTRQDWRFSALLPEIQRAAASMQREAKFAHGLGLALLQ
jgi:hypothetical protein